MDLARLLESDETALDGLRAARATATTAPDRVPVDLVRARLADHATSSAAIAVLSLLHLPEDAAPVLAALDQRGPFELAWLGPLAASDRLAPWLEPHVLATLLQHRWTAGLPVEHLGTDALLARTSGFAIAAPGGEELAAYLGIAWATEWFRAQNLAQPWYRQGAVRPLLAYGAAGRAVAATRNLEKHFDSADERAHDVEKHELASGDHWLEAERYDRARESFAIVLRRWRDHAYTAAQLAYLDRRGGTPIEERRITWLRSLGVSDETILTELATPIPPGSGTYDRDHIARLMNGCAYREID